MRDTVFAALPADADEEAVREAVEARIAAVADYVPGYTMKGDVLFDDAEFETPGGPAGKRATVLLEVRGAGDYLPVYAGNLDIMTAAALRVGERIAVGLREGVR